MKRLEQLTGWNITNIFGFDFNYPPVPDKRYDLVICLETLEHVQNPLSFMKYLSESITDDGEIFLITPARMRFLWTEHHFFEMSGDHIQKWLLDILGLKITHRKRVRITYPLRFYFTGIRPFLRLFFSHTWMYRIVRAI